MGKKGRLSTGAILSSILLSPWIYIPLAIFVGSIQYYGGTNEVLVEFMAHYYYNYGVIHSRRDVFVDTSYGRLQGFTSLSRDRREFYEFLGVPYAKPPVGELRFQPPHPPEKWDGVRSAKGYGHMCPQYDLFLQAVFGNEDCLTLNIHTPKTNLTDGRLFPVMVFVHGGMFMFGRGFDYRPEHFMDEDVVLVTLNYRLGPFGFLNTGDGVVRGNMGLKDQVMALRWINQNIAYFGGDPNLVTLTGESAGGASTHLHMLSPMSKGLFQRAISMSGNSLNQWAFVRHPVAQTKRFAARFGCDKPGQSTYELVACLRNVDTLKMTEILRETQDVLHHRLDVFAPSIESGMENENDTETFLADHPRNLLRKGEIVTKVPMISGVNANEGLIYAGYMVRNATCVQKLNSGWNQYAPVLIDYEDFPREQRDEVSAKIWNFYFGSKTLDHDTMYEIVDLFSDASFNKPIEEMAQFQSVAGPLFLYQYNFKGDFGLAQNYMRLSLKVPMLVDGFFNTMILWARQYLYGYREHHYGVCHGDEMALLFKLHPLLGSIPVGSHEYNFSKFLVKLWMSFIVNGEPGKVYGIPWEAVQPGQPFRYMKLLEEEAKMIASPFKQRLEFWNTLPGFKCLGTQYLNMSSCLS